MLYMAIKHRLALSSLLVCLSTVSAAAANDTDEAKKPLNQPAIALLSFGELTLSQNADISGSWFGLCLIGDYNSHEFQLAPARIVKSTVHFDSIVDPKGEGTTSYSPKGGVDWISYGAKMDCNPNNVEYLFQGSVFKAKSIKSAFNPNVDTATKIQYGSHTYQLVDKKGNNGCKKILYSDEFPKGQLLGECSNFSLAWAGDLDGDGKLDFIFDENNETYGKSFYLSSVAHENELVGFVARLIAAIDAINPSPQRVAP